MSAVWPPDRDGGVHVHVYVCSLREFGRTGIFPPERSTSELRPPRCLHVHNFFAPRIPTMFRYEWRRSSRARIHVLATAGNVMSSTF